MTSEKKNTRLVAIIIATLLGFGIVRQVMVVQHPEAHISPKQQHQRLKEKPLLRAATLLPTPRAIPAFNLINEKNEPVTEKTLTQNWHLLFFGYTQCPDICPATLSLLKPIMSALEPYGDTRFIFASVDPKQDTPAVLKAFLSEYDSHFMGLTGDEATMLSLLTSLNLYASTLSDQTLMHSTTLLLINPQGELIALFSKPENAINVIHDIEVLQGKKR